MGCQQGKHSAPAPKRKGEGVKSPLLLGNELPVAGTKEEVERETTFDDLREQVWRSSTIPSKKHVGAALDTEDDVEETMETFAGATEPEPDSEKTPRHEEESCPVAVAPAVAPAGPAAAPAEKVATPPPPGEVGRSYFSAEVRRDYAEGSGPGGAGRSPGVVTSSQEATRHASHRIDAQDKPRANDTPAPPADVLITAKDVSRAGEAAAARAKGGQVGELKAMAGRKEKNSCCC